eukprot:g15087.t1
MISRHIVTLVILTIDFFTFSLSLYCSSSVRRRYRLNYDSYAAAWFLEMLYITMQNVHPAKQGFSPLKAAQSFAGTG